MDKLDYKLMTEDNKLDAKSKKKGYKDPIYLKVLGILQAKFPNTFPNSEIRLLKIHIHKDIKQNTELTGSEIFRFLRKYCNSLGYTKAHKEGENRYNLDGEIIGIVTNEEAQNKSKLYLSSNNLAVIEQESTGSV